MDIKRFTEFLDEATYPMRLMSPPSYSQREPGINELDNAWNGLSDEVRALPEVKTLYDDAGIGAVSLARAIEGLRSYSPEHPEY